MRWLGILAIAIVGAAVYLYSQLSDGSTPARRGRAAEVATAVETAPAEAKPAPIDAADKPVPTPPPIASKVDKPSGTGNFVPQPSTDKPAVADANQEPVPWTDEERQQWLWTAHGRYEKGNFKGAIEASMELARRYPDSLWEQDALKVAVQAHCGMAEPEKASSLFARLTDKGAIEAASKVCTEWNVKLANSR